MTRTNPLPSFVLIVALAVVMGGCGGGVGDAADAPAGGTGASIVIRNFTYSPTPAQVSLGQSITVTNSDSAAHTLTVPAGVDSGNLAQGRSYTFTPTEAGTVDYLCDIHQYMKGQFVVR